MVLQFTQELTDLLTAGLQLEQALHAMENRSSPTLATLAAGSANACAMACPSRPPHAVSPSFGELYCNLVAAGEASGSLTAILDRQGRYLSTMEN